MIAMSSFEASPLFPSLHQEIRKNLASFAAPALLGCQCGRKGTQ